MSYQSYTLPNGIRLLHVHDTSPIVYCGFAVNVGTRDEHDDEQGMAHFVEHMLFKGTDSRKSYQIINRLESVGGQLEAYTTREETFIYATVPTHYCGRAMELLGDLVFHATFPAREMERELDVVLDEIQSYNDSPSELIYDDFDELLFAGSPLGRNILGKSEVLETFTPEKMAAFVKRCYTTDNLVFFTMGQCSFKQIVHHAERYFNVPASMRSFERTWPLNYTPTSLKTAKDTFQTHCLIGNRSYALGHPDRIALVLLNNILGGPNMSSRLNMSIRERNGLAYDIESNLTAYTDTGSWSVYVGCDPKYSKRCINLINKELDRLRMRPLDARNLQTAKRQLEGQLLIANENKENLILSMAKSYLHLNRCMSNDEITTAIAAISAQKMQQIANEVFAPDQLTQLIFY